MNRILIALACLVSIPAVGRAQALADRVPADAMVYVGWNGSNNLGPAFEQSHFKAILDHSDFSKLLHLQLPAMVARLADQIPIVGHYVQMASAICAPLWSHPSAMYFGGLDLTDPQHPNPKLAILCDAGNDAASMAESITSAVDSAADNLPLKISVKSFGTLVVVSTFDWIETPAHPLAQDATFKKTLARLSGDPFVTFYVDCEKIVGQAEGLVAVSHDPDAASTWLKVRSALGLGGLKQLIATDSFLHRDVCTQLFLGAPTPRVGLAALLDGGTLDSGIIKSIPSTVTVALAGRFDLANLYRQIRQGIATASPETAAQLDAQMAQINSTLGLDLQADVLNLIGSEWAAYVDPTVGDGALCGVLINRPVDAPHLATSLDKLEILANTNVDAQIRQMVPILTLQFRKEDYRGMSIHFAALPIITPAWTMSDGNWYLGLYPQTVAAAAQIAHDSSGKSILDNPSFQQMRAMLGGPADVSGFTYVDVPQLAPRGYGNVLMLSRLILGAGDLAGLQSPMMSIPTLADIKPELEPEGQIAWSDDSGFYLKSIESFPGDALLTTDSGAATSLFQMLGALAPISQRMSGGL